MAPNLEALLHCLEYFVHIKCSRNEQESLKGASSSPHEQATRLEPSQRTNAQDATQQNSSSSSAMRSGSPTTSTSTDEFNPLERNIPLWLSLIIDILEETIILTSHDDCQQTEQHHDPKKGDTVGFKLVRYKMHCVRELRSTTVLHLYSLVTGSSTLFSLLRLCSSTEVDSC